MRSFAVVFTVVFFTIISFIAAALYIVIRTMTLSVLQRNVCRFLVMAFVVSMIGLASYVLSGDIQALTLVLVILAPPVLVGHLVYGIAEYMRIKYIIRLDERMRQARQAGDLASATKYYQRAALLKKVTFGSFKEPTRAGIEY